MRNLFLCLLLLVFSAAAHAASFDCSKAATENEKHICANKALSNLDEQYAELYKSTKVANSADKSKLNKIKSDALAAFRSRESLCRDQLCLLSWYQKRIASLSSNGNASQSKLSISDLYYSLDLRTLPSSFGPRLKADCKSHLADYFPVSSLYNMTETGVSMNYNDQVFVLEIRGDNRFYHQDRVTNGTYHHEGEIDVNYSSNQKNWVANLANIKLPDHCIKVDIPWPNSSALRSMTLPKYSKVLPAFKGYEDSDSAGEINLLSLQQNQPETDETTKGISPYTVANPTVYNAVNGNPVGVLLSTLTRSVADQDYLSVQFLPYLSASKIQPVIIQRTNDVASLLFFEQKNGWVNFSADTRKSLWINLKDTPTWADLYKTRDDVIKGATRIEVRSAHNLRTAPSTSSEIIQVLGNGQNTDILPLAIKGDWMQVHTISPSPDHLGTEGGDTISSTALGPEYRQIKGWIKFRHSPQKELVNIVYDEFYPVVSDYKEFAAERY